MTIKEWLDSAIIQLRGANIDSAALDAQIILSHTIRHGHTYLHAHNDDALSSRHQEIADARLRLRLDRTPIAYIVGHKEFYGRSFQVTTATLIPRPESETIIEMLCEHTPATAELIALNNRLVDIGTGSGCLGITAKLERPDLDVTLIDISHHALAIAKQNAAKLGADVHVERSDLLSGYLFMANFVIANLPYVSTEWQRSPETNHEPELALFADDDGMALITKLLHQLPSRLASGGYAYIEADPRQHPRIIAQAIQYELTHVETR
ncbi:MAG: peptide chain release factor N(5)-glutamine methyltransferase [Candidatus Saccharimonadales bacterium]